MGHSRLGKHLWLLLPMNAYLCFLNNSGCSDHIRVKMEVLENNKCVSIGSARLWNMREGRKMSLISIFDCCYCTKICLRRWCGGGYGQTRQSISGICCCRRGLPFSIWIYTSDRMPRRATFSRRTFRLSPVPKTLSQPL